MGILFAKEFECAISKVSYPALMRKRPFRLWRGKHDITQHERLCLLILRLHFCALFPGL